MKIRLSTLTALALAAGLLLVLTPAGPAQAADTGQFTAMAEHYEPIWQALSGDTLDGVADHARAIAELAETGDHPADAREAVPEIVEHAERLAQAGDIDAAREAFGELTKPLVRYRKAVGAERLEVAYCPMAKKAWLQPEGDLANPYYGSEMLRCGDFVGS
jgi:hypothetical protein